MCCHTQAACAALAACKHMPLGDGLQADSNPKDADYLEQLKRPDPSSFANHDVAKVVNFHLDLDVDFEKSVLTGGIVVTAQAVADNAQVIAFDIRDLDISNVVTESGSAVEYWVSRTEGKLGQSLIVRLPNLAAGAEYKFRVNYQTSPTASATQWLSKEQTQGKEHPYLFTQCQAIHARSLMPCQDTPGVKSTYTAKLTVPAPLQALMSAILDSDTPSVESGKNVWSFRQPVPIPSYLLAILVGALEKRDISHRCAVWSEKETVDQAAYEFAETEKFLVAAESVCGPYEWTRYDLALLPGGFPFGGMENPQLTFVTPTLLAGDRSLANVVAHEIAHSWSGNLVTNKTWESFFLNEGFTVFIERKILEIIYGSEFKGLHTMIGWEDLKGSIAEFNTPETIKFTSLFCDLSNDADPDDAFSSVPYEKGFTLLSHLEDLVGGPELMNKFLKEYFAFFKFQSITAQDFQTWFTEFMVSNGVDATKLATFDWNTWFFSTGLPPKPQFNDVLARNAISLANALNNGTNTLTPEEVKMDTWTSTQKIVFLDKLIDLQDEATTAAATPEAKAALQARWSELVTSLTTFFAYNVTKNCELLFRYLTIAVRAGVYTEEIKNTITHFLSSYGRMKFTRPLYRDLFKSARYRTFGVELFAKVKGNYHNICATMVKKDQDEALKKDYVY